MALSISRLRGVLIGGAALLVLVLLTYIGVGRYRSLLVYRQLLKKSGITLTHDTNGFTYSQSLLDRKIFTLHAAKATQLGSGKWALHDADLTLFDKNGSPADHIRGSEIEYDEASQVVRAQGMVDMDLLPPQGLTNGGRGLAEGGEGTKDGAQPIHVRTSGLVYQRKERVATTAQEVDFSYGGMQCSAVGAEFDSSQDTVRLLAQVRMQGVAHGKPLTLNAAHAEMSRVSNVASLTQPTMTSDGESATADRAILNLRKDGSIERVQGIDHVALKSETRLVTAARLDATLNEQTLPESANLSGGVVLTGTDRIRPMHGEAETVDAVFDARGAVKMVTATGGAKLSMMDRKSDARGLNRSMEGATIVAVFVPGAGRSSARLTEVRAEGRGHAAGDSIVPVKGAGVAEGRKITQVWGDDLRLAFVANAEGKSQPHTLDATGHTVLRQDAPLGAQTTSSGDTLAVVMAPEPLGAGGKVGAMGIASAVQAGHVTMQNHAAGKVGSTEPGAVSTGAADNAAYDGTAQKLTLTGQAHLEGDDALMVAPTVVIDQVTQNMEARGGVRTTIEDAHAGEGKKQTSVTHVLSDSARFTHAGRLAEFQGTDAQPAKMWQNASQVQAATLLFDGVRKTLSARGAAPDALIHAVFVGAPAAAKPGAASKAASILRVSSPKMDYNDAQREAEFSGGVTMEGGLGRVVGQRAVVFLAPAGKKSEVTSMPVGVGGVFGGAGGGVERVVVSGGVVMDQPGRKGTGDQLLYTAAEGSYVLTGTAGALPRIVDTQQGTVTGATLLFRDAGSTIVVAGEAQGRVHTEMSIRPKTEERQ